jgi:prepilin-type N-terminal cleavage/methylation domain-containing protein
MSFSVNGFSSHSPFRGGEAAIFSSRRETLLKAFTLIEILAVLSIMSIMAVLAVPALSALTNSGNVTRAVGGISLLLNQARAYAMAHNTYVWIGFAANTDSHQLTVGAVAGNTGDPADFSSTTTCTPVAKLETYDHLSLKSISGLTGMATSADDIAASQVGTFQQTGGGTTVTFTNIVQFDPQGEATIDKTLGSSHWVQIGLQPIRGGGRSDPNVAVVQVSTLTGQVQVFRP